MRGVRRARARATCRYCTGKKTPVPYPNLNHGQNTRANRTPAPYSDGTVPVRYSTVPVPAKRHRGEPGHTRDTRAPVYRSYTADGVQKWQALSGAQFSSVSVHI